jgi:hypothetical protein
VGGRVIFFVAHRSKAGKSHGVFSFFFITLKPRVE